MSLHDLTLWNHILSTLPWVNTKRGKLVGACGTGLFCLFVCFFVALKKNYVFQAT